MSEQTSFAIDRPWIEIRDGNPSGMSIFKRHYTARANRKVFQFVGPGEKMVLITPDARALFVWRKFISDAGEVGVNCAVFRNEGTSEGISSQLIRAAKEWAWRRWPGERLYTYVDPSKVRRKRDPGRCFLKAGFKLCDYRTKDGKLVFEDVTNLRVTLPSRHTSSEYTPVVTTPRSKRITNVATVGTTLTSSTYMSSVVPNRE